MAFFFLNKFIYFNWRLITLQYCIGFPIHHHVSATGIHVFPILNSPSSSLPIPSPWVVPVHQPQASSIMHWTWTGDSFHIWYCTCFNAILPNHPTFFLSHRVPSRLAITFLPRSKRLLISWLQSPSAVILEPKKIKSVTVSTVSPSISWSDGTRCHDLSFLNVEL